MIELYQFPLSHFCEKARWALDYKSIAYRPVNLLPGFHTMRALTAEGRKISGKSSGEFTRFSPVAYPLQIPELIT